MTPKPSKPRPLTARFLATVKPPKHVARVVYRDAGCPGLEFRVSKTGAKTFSLRLVGVDGKTRRLSWAFPSYSLAEARDAAWAARRTRDKGQPVLTERQSASVGADGTGSVGWLLDRYVEKHVPRLRDADEVEKHIDRHIRPHLGKLALATITKQDVRRMLATVETRGPIIANATLRRVRAIFRWGQYEDLVTVDPTFGIREPHLQEPRQRTLTDAELSAIWRASLHLGYPAGSYTRFLILSGARRDEAREAHWREIDLLGGDWIVPAERFKSKRPHLLPLTATLTGMLVDMPYRDRGLYVFSARGAGARAYENLNKPKIKLETLSGVSDWTWHDLRRSLRSGLSRLGVAPHVAERVIGHADSRLGRTYDTHDYRAEKLEALTAWDRHVKAIVARV